MLLMNQKTKDETEQTSTETGQNFDHSQIEAVFSTLQLKSVGY